MNQRHYLLKGTFLLTMTGLLTRIAGFFYKIFLSRTIGAEQIGLFQLTVPLYSFCMALACGGIQTAISRFTAEHYANSNRRLAHITLTGGLLLSGGLSVGCSAVLYVNADWIALHFLLEQKCADLLRILAFSLPFCVIHSCLNGFFIGQKNVTPSAASQLIEQLLRISSVFLFYGIFSKNGREMNASVMALGQLAGEMSSALYCIYYLCFCEKHTSVSGNTDTAAHRTPHTEFSFHCFSDMASRLMSSSKNLLAVSVPLGLNRMLLCILQGIEASLLPQQLQRAGMSATDALSIYGTLTGMALPLIFFPTAVTGALGSLLLPAISEARALHHDRRISRTVDSSVQGGLVLGSFFLFALLLFGNETGDLLFHSSLAGSYICRLALLCPFLYLNTTLMSVLHGLGRTTAAFLFNLASFAIRFIAVIRIVPEAGMDGYLGGLIFSQMFTTACILILLHQSHNLTVGITDALAKPLLTGITGGAAICVLRMILPFFSRASWTGLLVSGLLYCMLFIILGYFLLLNQDQRRKMLARLTQLLR